MSADLVAQRPRQMIGVFVRGVDDGPSANARLGGQPLFPVGGLGDRILIAIKTGMAWHRPPSLEIHSCWR